MAKRSVSGTYAFSKNSGPSGASAKVGRKSKGPALQPGAGQGGTPGQRKVGSEAKRPKTVD